MEKQKNHPEGSTETNYACVTVLGYKSDSTNSADCFAIQCEVAHVNCSIKMPPML